MEKIPIIAMRIIRTCFFLLFILTPLILTPWNYELFEYNKMMVVYLLASLIAAAWVAKMASEKEVRIAATPLDIPIAVFVGAQLLSTLLSVDPHISWFGYYSRFNGGMMSVLTYITLYYAFVSNIGPTYSSNPKGQNSKFQSASWRTSSKQIDQYSISKQNNPIHKFLIVILVTGFVVSLYGIAEHFGIDKHLWVQDVQSRVFSTLGQPNWLAAYLVALIPLAMALGLKSQISSTKSQTSSNNQIPNKKRVFGIWDFGIVWNLSASWRIVIWNFFAVIFFLTLLYTRSRSGLLGFAVADILFWLFIFTHKKLVPHQTVQDWKQNSAVWSFVFIHIGFALIVFFNGTNIEKIDQFFTFNGLKQQLRNGVVQQSNKNEKSSNDTEVSSAPAGPLLEVGGTESGTIRKYVWQAAISAWKSSGKTMLLGTGTETFVYAFYRWKPWKHNLTSEWDFLYNKAHNEYLNYLATTGVLGLGTYLLFIGTFVVWFIKSQISSIKFQTNLKHQIPNKHNYNHLNFDIVWDLPAYRQGRDFGIWILRAALFAGWVSILVTNFFGFSVVVTQILLFLFPAMVFVLAGNCRIKTYHWTLSLAAQRAIVFGSVLSATLLVTMIALTWYADTLFAAGYRYERQNYFPQAYSKINSALRYNPTEPFYHDEFSSVLATLSLAATNEDEATLGGQLASKALRESDTATTLSPNIVNFWKTRTKVLYALSSGKPELLTYAIEALEKARSLSPSDPKIYYNLAILYGRNGDGEKAIEALKASIDLKPNYRDGYLGLALYYREIGETARMKETALEYLSKVDPNDEEMRGFTQ